MPERSFGRMLRYRRTKLGISQARLGQLVGRSAATIRSWESEKSVPNDPTLIPVLAAVIGVDEQTLYHKTGIEPPVFEETSPTIEEALASLAPPGSVTPPVVERSKEVTTESATDYLVDEQEPEQEAEQESESEPAQPTVEQHQDEVVPTLFETIDEDEELELAGLAMVVDSEVEIVPPVPGPDVIDLSELTRTVERPSYVPPPSPKPVQPAAVAQKAPVAVMISAEKSYIENRTEKQFYQFRTLATVVGLALLGIAFLWALSEGFGAFAEWWSEFFDNLRL